jgi:phospholipase/lecithinase/hemolysin
MACIINASTSAGLVQSADTSGVLQLQNNGTNALSVTSGNLQFNSGYGSVATAYGCRAWVNFNGTGTVAIRASGNVTSITDIATGTYTINMTTAMPDINYSVSGVASRSGTSGQAGAGTIVTDNSVNTARTTSAIQIIIMANGGDGAYDIPVDCAWVSVQIFR